MFGFLSPGSEAYGRPGRLEHLTALFFHPGNFLAERVSDKAVQGDAGRIAYRHPDDLNKVIRYPYRDALSIGERHDYTASCFAGTGRMAAPASIARRTSASKGCV